MSATVQLDAGGRQAWQRFLVLILLFLLAILLASIAPTPDSWSDGRSQWMPAAITGLSALALLVATFWSYCLKRVSRMQAAILSFVFGAALIVAVFGLYESLLFLREVRRHQSTGRTQTPNHAASGNV